MARRPVHGPARAGLAVTGVGRALRRVRLDLGRSPGVLSRTSLDRTLRALALRRTRAPRSGPGLGRALGSFALLRPRGGRALGSTIAGTRPHIALPRPRIALARLRIALARCSVPTPRLPSPLELAFAGALLVALVGAYAVARETSVFAVREVAVEGAPAPVERQVRATLASLTGTSLVLVDATELARRIEAIPTVESARVDRAFPHAVRVAVRTERPLAVLREGRYAVLVSVSGRVIRTIRKRPLPRLPRIWLAGLSRLRPGESVPDEASRLALKALGELPRRFPERVLRARAHDGLVTLLLRGGAELRLGAATGLRAKLEVAGAVLAKLAGDERARLAYVDAAVPAFPVVADKPKVESEG